MERWATSVLVPVGDKATVTATGADEFVAPRSSKARAVNVWVPSGALLQTKL